MPELSPGPLFGCWFAAYLTGRTSLDDALDAITADGAVHHLVGLDDKAGSPTPLVLAMGRLRSSGVDRVAVSLPAPGDPAGLAGPADFNVQAIEAGEAVMLDGAGIGLLPEAVGGAVLWQASAASVPPPADLGEADRELRSALRESADCLSALDVARWRPEVADALLNLRRPGNLAFPPGMDPRAVALAGMAARCRSIVDLAMATPGGAISAPETAARATALRPLDRAARRGLAAACSSPVPR